MGKLKKPSGEDEHYTMVPNRIIRSKILDSNDKAIFACIASCNPSFPTFDDFSDWTGVMNRTVITRSLKRLEANGVIQRYKVGRQIYYVHYWNGDGSLPKSARLVTYGDYNSNGSSLESVTGRHSKKNKEKEQTKSAPETPEEIGRAIEESLELGVPA